MSELSCGACGVTVSPDARFCVGCGGKFDPEQELEGLPDMALPITGATRPPDSLMPNPVKPESRTGLLTTCPDCGQRVSARALSCPHCGAPVHIESRLVVYGYTQQFLINPKVEVYWNNSFAGFVKKGDRITLDIVADGTATFVSSIRRAQLQIAAGRVTSVKISWDRLTGKLIPQIVDIVTPGS